MYAQIFLLIGMCAKSWRPLVYGSVYTAEDQGPK